jgi:hypothetical protein
MTGLTLGGGAQFWAYVSPQNHTANWVPNWTVTIQQGSWIDTITSADPQRVLQTPGLSGLFQVTVTGSGPMLPEQQLQPQSGSEPEIGCHDNCASMVGIIASPDGTSAQYWTTWDAMCSQKG